MDQWTKYLLPALGFLAVALFILGSIRGRWRVRRRLRLLERFERERESRIIILVHRQERFKFLGLPFFRFIDIEDSELVLQAIRETSDDQPLDLILHTPGGLALAADQIAMALYRHPAKVTVFVPHYAMSGGTLIALAADEVFLDENAVLGPVDPQLGEYAAASVLAAVQVENPNRDDRTLILADVARKAIQQMEDRIFSLVQKRLGDEAARELAKTLTEGRWTHDHAITADEAKALGIPVETGLPDEIYDLMRLHPRSGADRSSVEYVPKKGRRTPTPEAEPEPQSSSQSES